MKQIVAFSAVLALTAIPAIASEANFQRSLNVGGHVELTVSTSAGNVHITRGADSQVHIYGHVKSGWGAGDSDQRVRAIAANPPIEQTGDIIQIGGHHFDLHNISISYEIQAPANSFLQVSSGSGDLAIEGVGDNAKLTTGSGSIHASSLHGGFTLHTGSGSIFAEQTGSGDVRADTGSGNIELRAIHGGLRATTGSGSIKVAGAPAGDWYIQTGSGNVEVWPGNSGLTLNASTGSGSVQTDHEMSMQGTFNRHHVTGRINGGGPTVRISTGSGDVRIH